MEEKVRDVVLLRRESDPKSKAVELLSARPT